MLGIYYEQQLTTPCLSKPHIIVTGSILLCSNVRISQSKWCAITVDIPVVWWCLIIPKVSTAPLSSVDRVLMIDIL